MAGGNCLNFGLLKNCQKIFFLSKKIYLQKCKIWGWKLQFWGNSDAKLEFWASVIFSVGNLHCMLESRNLLLCQLFNPRCEWCSCCAVMCVGEWTEWTLSVKVSSADVCGHVSLDAVDWTLPRCLPLHFSRVKWSLYFYCCSLLAWFWQLLKLSFKKIL